MSATTRIDIFISILSDSHLTFTYVATDSFSHLPLKNGCHRRGENKMSFGERLKELIEERKITQRQLAKELNIATTTISGYATNSREPSLETLISFAEYFHVSVDYLIGYSTVRHPAHDVSDQTLDRLLSYYKRLSPDIQELLVDQARVLLKYNSARRGR